MPTNDERAERGRMILDFYAAKFGDPYDATANLTDVLADLMHTAFREHDLGLKFHERLNAAMMHFEEETVEEG
ncbi:MAG: hypothetical protein P0119_07095 [Nitrospira sp.]|nr:hypothetical protein [Nitrospira sp.]